MRGAEFTVNPRFEGAEGAKQFVEPGAVDEAEAEDGKKDGEGSFVETHFGADFVGPNGGDFADGEAGAFQRVKEIDVERDVGDAEVGMNLFHRGAAHHFGSALGVFDAHVEQHLDIGVEDAAEDAAFGGLSLFEHGSFNPAGTDRAIHLGAMANQIEESRRGGGSIGIDVANEVRLRPKAKALNQGAAFADRRFEFKPPNLRKFGGSRLDDPERVVTAAVKDDDDFEFARVIRAEKRGVIAQNRADPLFFVVSGDQQQDAR